MDNQEPQPGTSGVGGFLTPRREPMPRTHDVGGSSQQIDQQMDEQVNIAKEKATKLVLEAEQFKASVNAPTGTDNNHVNKILATIIFSM